jgi:preprotein translocase subunit SecE
MAKDDKKGKSSFFEEQKAQEAKEAKKKLKAAEKAAPGGGKEKKADKKAGAKKIRKWLKDFRGELKKIVWPDFKTVMKNTGIVLVTVIIIGALVWVVDFILTQSITGLKTLASGLPEAATEEILDEEELETTAAALEDITEPEAGEETTAPAEPSAETE